MTRNNFIRGSRVDAAAPPRKVLVGPQQNPAPQVILKKEGDVVKSIEVQCRCGERFHILCEYEHQESNHA